ncbi:diguanylate cyclase/phosphodiesterase (GGDEF & EAL domains) with PAS/PAC sensor(s) [Nitrincola lacisaponensis]|uniref:Diguanylate cyclase/phosphodiesterase (GGDEF & EAL domains) with PAS/PAC sensor(S) n=1 Tax=Nitrincola lacisaponensis TaxID=267850 RepID=A0A063Y8E9_9GAMM|nr:EAL domain-containing protein [Nitrincola lacisaponensis]KDE40996.1 diguanylate cyclase/phosphodiesterase (GGDEF & EAL domains) with PAS/PAC sensor(s) [Nitrincola lacisaponensis]
MNNQLQRSDALKVMDICRQDVVTCQQHETVASAIRLMADYNIGSVIVCNDQHPVGILTRRDAMRVVPGPQGEPLQVKQAMSAPLITITPDASIDELGIELMSGRIRHAVVVDQQGRLIGVVSESDIVNSHGLEHDLFMRSVYDVCSHNPLRFPEDCSLRLAVERIRAAGHTAAMIEGLNGELKIITETDIIRLLASVPESLDKPLYDFSFKKLISVPGTISLFNARRHFRKHGFRHLGVLNDAQEVIGLASYSDILRNVELDYIFRLRELLNDRSYRLNETRNHLRIIEKVIDSSMEGIVICNAEGNIQSVNPAFTQITGYQDWEVIGSNPNILSSGRHDKAFYDKMWDQLRRKGRWQGEIWNRNKSGRVYPEWLSITAIESEQGEVIQYAAIFHDLTEIKRSEARINKMSYFDEVTHLANRRLFIDRLHNALAYAADHDDIVALVNLDLDWFKTINDRFGQTEGDLVLREIARRLEEALGDADTAARPGGDEFSIIMTGLGSTDQLPAFLDRLTKVISAPVLVKDTEVRLTASIGIALFPVDAHEAEGLLRCADAAMHEAKKLGRNSYHFFSSELDQQTRSRFQLTSLLQGALEKQEFQLFYQPKVCLKTGQVTGVEALLRWFSSELGEVSPSDFIPLAEDMGLIDTIGDWVMEAAIQQAVAWKQAGLSINVGVNVSARQFQRGNVAGRVIGLLNRYALEPQYFSIELTETSFMHSAEKTRSAISELLRLGVSVAIDDFGTGYSSLNYVRTLALSQLKIDLSFIRNIETSEKDRRLVEAMVAMAHAMDLEVIAEGVETPQQLDLLQRMGCDQGQGYYFSRPQPEETLTRWLQNRPLKC